LFCPIIIYFLTRRRKSEYIQSEKKRKEKSKAKAKPKAKAKAKQKVVRDEQQFLKRESIPKRGNTPTT
jgi:hypothetical protein